MTALEDAAKAVERTRAALMRELASPTEWTSGEYGCDEREAHRLANNLVAAVRHHDAEIVRADTAVTAHPNPETDGGETA